MYVAEVKHVIHTDLTDAAEDMRMRNVSTRLYEGSIKRRRILSCHAQLTRDKSKKKYFCYKLDKHFSTKFNKYMLFDSQHMTCMSISAEKKNEKKNRGVFSTQHQLWKDTECSMWLRSGKSTSLPSPPTTFGVFSSVCVKQLPMSAASKACQQLVKHVSS